MKCPFCGFDDSKVVESRSTDDGNKTRRRRECLSCFKRFTTYEYVENRPLIVIKRDNTREDFDRNKLIGGILKACSKRSISVNKIEQMASNIEQKLLNTFEKEVSSEIIGEMVMKQLCEVDEVAYIRFASVYKHFKDVDTFMYELKSFLNHNQSDI
ncbi:MAG: transcriptional regulator NrdR [Oscillospiraceae bacterium]|nr:transcriptional regulator NrdR [Oscillospiraceae bacterium]